MKSGLLLCCVLLSFGLTAQSEAYFEKATAAYNEGSYEHAVDNYLKILENGEHSAALYYNLGNSYYKLNEIAPSIYYYEKALLLDPTDSEIKNNLAYARNMTLDAFEPVPETGISRLYSNLTGVLSFDQWAYLAIGLMFLFVLSYIAFYYLRYSSHKRIAFTTSMIALIFSINALLFAFFQYNEFKADKPAIVFSEEIVVKSEPNDRSSEAFVLHEGTKVNVLDELSSWKKIELVDGKTGWIPEEAIKMLKDF